MPAGTLTFFFFTVPIAAVIFFVNYIAILKKIKQNEETLKNTIVCSISLIFIIIFMMLDR